MANGGASIAQAAGPGPKPLPLSAQQPESAQQKKDLASWWRNFKRSDKKAQEQQGTVPHGIFGIPLPQSIRYANVAISLYNDEGQSYIYGYVPIVVAKCGVYLKEKATDVEGIFRLAGSEKRIKELKVAFDSPDRYGKGLDWTGYTVHDAANILRRYFNQLPEPIIPLNFYERFREPLRNHQAQAVGHIEAQSPSVGNFDQESAIKVFQNLITELPPLNRQLLLYILDLLAVFASKSDLNKMTTANLAAIFQPGILSHPQHDMAPQEYRLSQDVLIFLIENQDSFLIGMSGTEADPETVRDVQSGTPAQQPTTPTTPSRVKTGIGRSSSSASAGAESVRKFGNIRRNVSVSSRHSRRSESGPTPVTPAIGTTPSTPTSGVYRSNTAPSRRKGGSNQSPRFSRDKTSDPPTPSPGAATITEERRDLALGSMQSTPVATIAPTFPDIPSPQVLSASSSEATTPLAGVGSDTASTVKSDYTTPKKDTTPLLAPPGSMDQTRDRSTSNTPSTASSRGFLDIFKQSPISDGEGRKPNKLQKKRIPGSSLSSAQSSTQSLEHVTQQENFHQRPPVTPPNFPQAVGEGNGDEAGTKSAYATAQTTPVQPTPQRNPTDATLRPTTSPTQSYHSTDLSDADMVGDDMPTPGAEQPDQREKKRHRWRLSRSQNKLDTPQTPNANNRENPMGNMAARELQTSRSTVGSSVGGGQARRSFQEPTALMPSATDPAAGTPIPTGSLQSSSTEPQVFSDSEREKKGPMSWIRSKIQERKERDAEKRERAKTPERGKEREVRTASKQDLRLPSDAIPARGKSLDVQRASAAVAAGPASTSGNHSPTSVGVGAAPMPTQMSGQGHLSAQVLHQPPTQLQGPPLAQVQTQVPVQKIEAPQQVQYMAYAPPQGQQQQQQQQQANPQLQPALQLPPPQHAQVQQVAIGHAPTTSTIPSAAPVQGEQRHSESNMQTAPTSSAPGQAI
ncbi:GTPase activating protein (GAP) for Rho1p [Recurvomyces mirabilis]|uniref:GTPase activating protein (GAP) for Rho1p n=1 Tax=Recurvomyces mirabilis TaxID=574656 RepID=A0AAE1BZG8_9PEZI|nr:GTPase activating protein (GAP) for Rho1p [Recurvomyces mirabilis]KAK5151491.1 GTPase activating protein (GAP) for Rho1p [Recurvomyces mirabilis]